VIDKADTANTKPIIDANHAKKSRLMTDQAFYYIVGIGKEFTGHESVDRRGDCDTNILVGYFSIFKRGMKGSISTAAKSTYIGILQSSIFGTIIM